MVAVKTYDTESALESVSHLRVGSVLSIQNGVLKDEQLAHTFGWDKTLGAAAFLSGGVPPAGPVRFTVNEYLVLGELPAGISARVQTLVTALGNAGIRAGAVPRIQTVEWSKYAPFMSWMAPADQRSSSTPRIHPRIWPPDHRPSLPQPALSAEVKRVFLGDQSISPSAL